jgi:hypothetical protein
MLPLLNYVLSSHLVTTTDLACTLCYKLFHAARGSSSRRLDEVCMANTHIPFRIVRAYAESMHTAAAVRQQARRETGDLILSMDVPA